MQQEIKGRGAGESLRRLAAGGVAGKALKELSSVMRLFLTEPPASRSDITGVGICQKVPHPGKWSRLPTRA